MEEKKLNGLFGGFFERGECGGVSGAFGQGIPQGGACCGECPVLPSLVFSSGGGREEMSVGLIGGHGWGCGDGGAQ